MKRSKMFLALTASLLSVAAFAATKANHRALTHYYLITQGHCNLHNTPPSSGCTTGTASTCRTGDGSVGNRTLFLTSPCVTALRTTGGGSKLHF